MAETVSVTITQKQNYQFLVDFGDAIPSLVADEPAPLGEGEGPAPTHMLLAAVANCLSASLLFSLKKFKQDAGGITTKATCIVDRNDSNRLRVQQIDVAIQLGKEGAQFTHLDRVLGQFENFCTVTQSVQAGIPVKITVTDGKGVRLE
ncbi:MAG TPA: peroxiredoxin [Polaromonas sp.]|uniref:OsmC family protein n=1 Tax=Polaromonas sp. UBA4122 TaxID=1947074 RepID=UPI000EE7525F|nr:OsmC family protein [Polaromonas sp. UBA4122]HAL40125.1 peroxiredoxin [Polaromonas sp.]